MENISTTLQKGGVLFGYNPKDCWPAPKDAGLHIRSGRSAFVTFAAA